MLSSSTHQESPSSLMVLDVWIVGNANPFQHQVSGTRLAGFLECTRLIVLQ